MTAIANDKQSGGSQVMIHIAKLFQAFKCCFPRQRFAMVIVLFAALKLHAAAELTHDRFVIQDAGQPRVFAVALDELHVTTSTHQHSTRHFTPLENAEAVRQRAIALSRSTGDEVELVLYETSRARKESNRRILTKKVLVQLEPETDAAILAQKNGAISQRGIQTLPGFYIFESGESGGALLLAETLRAEKGVLSAEPQLARQQQKRFVPNDPLFNNQWHLRNTGQTGGTAGIDVNVTNVWENFRGTNVGLAIVDDGLQYTHPDLQPNYDPTTSTNINDQTADPYPNVFADFHGTSCAGVAAARGNNSLGVCGAAFEARLSGVRLIGAATTDSDEETGMSYRNDVLHIKSNSWGPADDGITLEGPGILTANALAQGALTGRNGLGTIYVWAGGNGLGANDNANYDGYVNSIYTIGVGAVSDQGFQASYSEPGACLVVAAPSSSSGRVSITTTDLLGNDGYSSSDYTSSFGGTSSATPLVSGVIALLLQANPNLGWRDVQEILMRSATKNRPTDGDWATNSAGFHFNHKFGAGLVNAGAAQTFATNWTNLASQLTNSSVQTNLSVSIPDNDTTGITRSFDMSNTSLRVEHITVTVNINHLSRGNLAVTLLSPSGMQSRLAEVHGDTGDNYANWKFMSVRHWGEISAGTWSLQISDRVSGTTGTLTSARLDIYGTQTVLTNTTDLALSMSDAPDPVFVGSNLTYTLSVTNFGPAIATNVFLTNFLPANVMFLSASNSQGSSVTNAGKVISNLGTLAGNQSATVTILVTPTTTGIITNVAVVTAGTIDQNSPNNSASVQTQVAPPPPMISNVAATARVTSAFVTWKTFSNATTQVSYGLTTNYSNVSSFDPRLTTNHVVWLTGLQPETTYYFRVLSVVQGTTFSAEGSFFTSAGFVIDNPAASFSGSWSLTTGGQGEYGADYRSASTVTNSPNAEAFFTPNFAVPGKYDISIWYPSSGNRTTNAQVLITGSLGTLVVGVDQTINGSQWNLLATNIDFAAGTNGFVSIQNGPAEKNKVVVADAVQFSENIAAETPMDGSVPPWWSSFYFGTNVSGTADFDLDGYSDYSEFVLGTAPNDASSRLQFRIERNPGGGARAIFSPLQGGRTYQLQFIADVASSAWTTLTNSPTVNTNGEGVITISDAPATSFYRLMAHP